MAQFYSFNPNPRGRNVGDCAVRAVAKTLDMGWYEAFAELTIEGLNQCDLPSANSVWGAVLRKHGFERAVIPAECPDCYTVSDFLREYPHGRYVIALNGHVVAVEDGKLYDTWNSLDQTPLYFWRDK